MDGRNRRRRRLTVERSERHQLSRLARLHSRRAECPAEADGLMRCPLGGKGPGETTRGQSQERGRGRAIIAARSMRKRARRRAIIAVDRCEGEPGGRQVPPA
jgi:hypothetical protein